MEYVDLGKGERLPIPDAVVAASDRRDLVADYLAASPADREHIHQLAIEQTTPKEQTPALTPPPAAAVVTPAPAPGEE